MTPYGEFARFYSRGGWTAYSTRMAEKLGEILERAEAGAGRREGRTLLDLACGEGSFAVAAALSGYEVTGVDRSPAMLALARDKAEAAGAVVDWREEDIRALTSSEATDLHRRFDLVTCWFDSLNYLLTLEDLKKAFRGAAGALLPGGIFLFDMNTIYGLAVVWQRDQVQVEMETAEMMVLRRSSYDYERDIATLTLTCFERSEDRWLRWTEEHKERGYPLEEIRRALARSGLTEIASWGSLLEWRRPEAQDGRVWFAARLVPSTGRPV